MLVAPDVDALCASRILADLLKQDDIMHRTIPVSGLNELERIRDDLVSNSEVRPRTRDLTIGLPYSSTAENTHSHQYGIYP